jgi:23S rRNA (guanine745-N1)-methyltransferase
VCGEALTLDAAHAVCAKAHSFDRARSGYLNLLLSNRKQSAEPGDSEAMLQSRRAFLQAGFYNPMSAAVNRVVGETLAAKAGAHVADIGCGEGFFTARLKRALDDMRPAPVCYGVDISRPGVKMAAPLDRGIHWVVGSLHRSPFLPRSLDVAVSMFAPIDAADMRRVVRDDGALVTVTPGPDHLDGLRALLYATVDPHPSTPSLMAGDTLFELSGSTRVREPIAIDSQAQIMNLLAMTPYYWNISRETRARIEALERLDLMMDAYVNVGRRQEYAPRYSAGSNSAIFDPTASIINRRSPFARSCSSRASIGAPIVATARTACRPSSPIGNISSVPVMPAGTTRTSGKSK